MTRMVVEEARKGESRRQANIEAKLSHDRAPSTCEFRAGREVGMADLDAGFKPNILAKSLTRPEGTE
jgi:hypothetical protein